MRLIDADKLKQELKTLPIMSNWGESFMPMLINEQPTVEAAPVVRGSWETEFTALLVVYRCSECNCATALGQTNFCPNCGADMRKKVQDGKID